MGKNISIFDDYFEPQIRERGIGYYYNDLIKNIKTKDHTSTATIEGTRVYQVELKLNEKEDKIVEAKCNCPYQVDREKYCKHIYALLYALKGDKLDTKPIKKPTRYTPPTGEIVNVKCPNCGSNLRVEDPKETIECKYCHSFFALDVRLIGKEKRLKEMLDQAELYFSAEDYKEAFYEFAKAHALDEDNKYIKYCMDLSNKMKNLETNISLNDYSYLYNELKEALQDPTIEEDKKSGLLNSFLNLLTKHANKHLNRWDISGEYFWIELDGIIDYLIKILKEFDLTDELIETVYDKYRNVLEQEIEHYDKFERYATNPKLALQKALYRVQRELEKLKKK